MIRNGFVKIPPNRRKTAYSSLRRIAGRMGARFSVRRLESDPLPIASRTRLAPKNRRRLSGPALRTFLAIADLWGLTEKQRLAVLGNPSRSAYISWSKKVRENGKIYLNVDILMRISAVLGIHQNLAALFPEEPDGVAWLLQSYQARVFGGNAPLDLLLGGSLDSMMTIRRFLAAAGNGLYMPPSLGEVSPPYEDSEIIFL